MTAPMLDRDKLAQEVVKRAEMARKAQSDLSAAQVRYANARAEYRAAEKALAEAEWAASKAKSNLRFAENGDIPLSDGVWLSGKFAEEHPEVLDKAGGPAWTELKEGS